MRQHVPEGLALRILQTTFVSPVPAGEVMVRARHLRSGRSATHVEARILQSGETAALFVGVFGARRPSRVRVVPERRKFAAEPPMDIAYVPGLSPTFVQHFHIRWHKGGLPFTGSAIPEAVVEIGMPDERTTTAEHVVAIADVIAPLALSYLDAPTPASSITWTLEMLTDSLSHLSPRGFFVDATLVAAGDGYTSQSVTLWGPDGEPLALSRQGMVVFG
jgi:hypothetical protein